MEIIWFLGGVVVVAIILGVWSSRRRLDTRGHSPKFRNDDGASWTHMGSYNPMIHDMQHGLHQGNVQHQELNDSSHGSSGSWGSDSSSSSFDAGSSGGDSGSCGGDGGSGGGGGD